MDVDACELDVDATRRAPWAPLVVANLTLPLLRGRRGARQPPERLIASGVLGQRRTLAPRRAWPSASGGELDGWAAVVLEAA